MLTLTVGEVEMAGEEGAGGAEKEMAAAPGEWGRLWWADWWVG
jgi:hypothetical protein